MIDQDFTFYSSASASAGKCGTTCSNYFRFQIFLVYFKGHVQLPLCEIGSFSRLVRIIRNPELPSTSSPSLLFSVYSHNLPRVP